LDSTFCGRERLWKDAWPYFPGLKVGQVHLYPSFLAIRPVHFFIIHSVRLFHLAVFVFLSQGSLTSSHVEPLQIRPVFCKTLFATKPSNSEIVELKAKLQLEQFATTPALPGWGGSDRQQVNLKFVFSILLFIIIFLAWINQPLQGREANSIVTLPVGIVVVCQDDDVVGKKSKHFQISHATWKRKI
jgi:hypothetical protein